MRADPFPLLLAGMKPEKILAAYSKHTERWLRELERFTDETFVRSLPGEWSVSKVTDHICKTTRKCLDMAERCCEGKGEKGHSGFGPAVFSLMGAFPPVR